MLQEISVIKRFGFLYGGYAFPYWEVADMIRKLAIAAIPVFIKVQPLGSLQAVLGEIVLVIYIFVVSYLKPFGNPHDNLLQVGSMIGKFPTQKQSCRSACRITHSRFSVQIDFAVLVNIQ